MTESPSVVRAIIGPTASGKGKIALAVARRIGAQIVSLDSMKVYRRMDVGTAKPSESDRQQVPHHLIDTVETDQPYSVADYCRDATAVCKQVETAGELPLFVGGTALYLKALLQGILPDVEPDLAYRRQLDSQAAGTGPALLHQQLSQVDPASAQRIHPNDQLRIVRALEYHHTNGKPISLAQTQWDQAGGRPSILVGIRWPREILNQRINRRVERMFALGLVDEVQHIQAGGGFGLQARQALGYKELLNGQPLDQAQATIQLKTRQFAKRQMTWFRKFDGLHWIDMNSETDLEPAVERAVTLLAPKSE